jgi:hypothetical protein
MPPLPDVAQVVKVEVIQDSDGIPVVNLLHYRYTGGPPSIANLTTFATTVHAQWLAHIMTDLATTFLLEEVIATDLTSATSARGSFTLQSAGAAVDEQISANAACVIAHNIARRYRGGHPRSYLCGLVATDLFDSHTLNPANVAAFQVDWDTFTANVIAAAIPGTASTTYVNVSYRTGNAPRVVPLVDAILSSTVRARVGSQRRRLGP